MAKVLVQIGDDLTTGRRRVAVVINGRQMLTRLYDTPKDLDESLLGIDIFDALDLADVDVEKEFGQFADAKTFAPYAPKG